MQRSGWKISRIKPLDVNLINILLGTKIDNRLRMNGFPPPDFTRFDFCTKTAPAMSEEEFREAIIEQAKKDAAKGICGGESAGYRNLMKSYISVVSPDRKGIIAKASQSFAGKGRISFAEFKDAGNNVIAHYSPYNGWTMVMTKAEMTRTSEFSAIYVEAWREAHYGKGNTIDGVATSSGSIFSASV